MILTHPISATAEGGTRRNIERGYRIPSTASAKGAGKKETRKTPSEDDTSIDGLFLDIMADS
jgi:hypothetical protein